MITAKIKSFLKKVNSSYLELKYGKKISEEVIILNYFQETRPSGPELIMIDVGAHHGGALLPFVKDGWSVWAFEPDEENRAVLKQNIKKEGVVLKDIDPRALSDKAGISEFFTSDVSTGISGLLNFHDSHQSTYQVETITLNQYLEEKNIKNFDFLKIDTEGFDLFVLKGLDLSTYFPEIIMCEYENAKTKKLNYTLAHMISYLDRYGYASIISEWYPIKEYGSRHRWNKFTMSEEDTDNNSWGNIIAVKKRKLDNLIGSIQRSNSLKVHL